MRVRQKCKQVKISRNEFTNPFAATGHLDDDQTYEIVFLEKTKAYKCSRGCRKPLRAYNDGVYGPTPLAPHDITFRRMLNVKWNASSKRYVPSDELNRYHFHVRPHCFVKGKLDIPNQDTIRVSDETLSNITEEHRKQILLKFKTFI